MQGNVPADSGESLGATAGFYALHLPSSTHHTKAITTYTHPPSYIYTYTNPPRPPRSPLRFSHARDSRLQLPPVLPRLLRRLFHPGGRHQDPPRVLPAEADGACICACDGTWQVKSAGDRYREEGAKGPPRRAKPPPSIRTRDAQHADAAGPLAPDRRHQRHGRPGLPVALAPAPEHEHARAGLVVVPDCLVVGVGGGCGYVCQSESTGPGRSDSTNVSTDRTDLATTGAAPRPQSPRSWPAPTPVCCGCCCGGGRFIMRRAGKDTVVCASRSCSSATSPSATHPSTHTHRSFPPPCLSVSV